MAPLFEKNGGKRTHGKKLGGQLSTYCLIHEEFRADPASDEIFIFIFINVC